MSDEMDEQIKKFLNELGDGLNLEEVLQEEVDRARESSFGAVGELHRGLIKTSKLNPGNASMVVGVYLAVIALMQEAEGEI